MSKLGKVTLGMALFLLMAGGLLALSGWFMGGDTSIEYTKNNRTVVVSPFGIRWNNSSSTSTEVWERAELGVIAAQADLGTFTDLLVDVPLADVVLQQGDEYTVKLEWSNERFAMDYSVENGRLEIWARESGNFGWNGDWDHEATVTVTYPAASLGAVEVRTGMGDVDVFGLIAKSLTLSADMGSATLADALLETADFTLDMGQLDADNLEVTGLITATASMGSIDLQGRLRDMDLTSDMGDVTVFTDLPQTDFTYDLQVDMGDLVYGSSRASNGEMSGGNGPHTIKADCSMGSIEIYFD